MAGQSKKYEWHNVRGVTEQELSGDSETLKKYGDILYEKWDGVRSHKKASPEGRAAQFSPFAALTGFSDMIDEAGRQNNKDEDIYGDV